MELRSEVHWSTIKHQRLVIKEKEATIDLLKSQLEDWLENQENDRDDWDDDEGSDLIPEDLANKDNGEALGNREQPDLRPEVGVHRIGDH